MTVPGYSVCRYDIVWERYCHKSVNNFIKETKTSVSSSLSKGSPTKLIEHCCNTRPIIIITGRPACRSSLDFLKLESFIISMRVPNRRGVLQLRADKRIVGCFSHLWVFGLDVTPNVP